MKVVINKDFGGFGLSDEAFEDYLNTKGIPFTKENNTFGFSFYESTNEDANMLFDQDIPRDDPVLVEVVERFGSERASGPYASLKIVDIPEDVDWYVAEYDGLEHIAERHRTWS